MYSAPEPSNDYQEQINNKGQSCQFNSKNKHPEITIGQAVCSERSSPRRNSVVLPKALDVSVNFSHEGHQGIVVIKVLLLSAFWFPSRDCMIEDIVCCCFLCQDTTQEKRPLHRKC